MTSFSFAGWRCVVASPSRVLSPSVLLLCRANSVQTTDLVGTRISVIARSDATKQSPTLILQLLEIASLCS